MEGVTERKPAGMSFETWVERQIAQGMARGAFDDLPGAGKPLPARSAEETAYDWVIEKARKFWRRPQLTPDAVPGPRCRRDRRSRTSRRRAPAGGAAAPAPDAPAGPSFRGRRTR